MALATRENNIKNVAVKDIRRGNVASDSKIGTSPLNQIYAAKKKVTTYTDTQ